MAEDKDNNNDKEKIKILEEQNRLYKRQLELQEEGYNLSSSYLDSLKDVLGIRSKLSSVDKDLLDLNKKINKEILNQKTGLDKASDVQSQINKNAALLSKASILQSNLEKIANKEKVNAAAAELSKIHELQSQREELIKGLQETNNLSQDEVDLIQQSIQNLNEQINLKEKINNENVSSLSSLDKQLLYTKLQREELEKQNNENEKIKKYLKEREKSLGLTGKLAKALSDIPGLREIFGNPEYMEQVNKKVDAVYQKTGKFPGLWKTLGIQIGVAGKMIGKTLMDPLTLITLMVKGFSSLNEAQTNFQRETGRTVSHIDTLNASLISSSDYIKQATAMTKELGLAADLIFTSNTLQEAAEMVELMGMSAQEATRLSVLSKINGKELKTTNENIVKIVSNFNKNNKAAISQKAVLQDVAKVSNSIAMTFGGNPEKIAAAAAEARKLGLTLETVDKVAESLLNFEQSINAEISAELITGQELNLEKARLYALNDDIASLTKEIGNNEGIINGYTKGNRIQRQAIADAIGMSKDELAKMVFDQQIQNGLTEEQAAKAAGVALEDMKRLSVQDSINKSIEKMGEALAGPLEMVAQLMSHATAIKIIFATIASIMTIQLVKSTAQFVMGIGRSIGPLAIRLGLIEATAVAEMTAASAATLGLGVIGIIAGIIAGVAAMNSATKSMKDGKIDPNKGPIMTGNFGSVQLNPKDKAMYGADGKIKVGTDLMGKTENPINSKSITPVSSITPTSLKSITPPPSSAIAAASAINNTATVAKQDNKDIVNELKALKTETTKANSKPTIIENNMNGSNFGTAVAMNTYKTQ